jgi:hypothetical protein
MDPFIEAGGLWRDFHHHLIEGIYTVLSETLPDRYLVRTGERSYLVLVGAEGKIGHPFYPDVSLATAPVSAPPPSPGAATAVAEPATEVMPVEMRAFIEEEYRETFVEIHESGPDQRLVTAIEVLSPTNKRRGAPGWELYLRKRQALLLSEANLVEIDLLRGGDRMPMLDPWPNSPYTLLVARKGRADRCRVWPAFALRPLPAIGIPLALPDPDCPLSLQPLIAGIYARSRYDRSIDYSCPPTTLLLPEEVSWLREHIAAERGSLPESGR